MTLLMAPQLVMPRGALIETVKTGYFQGLTWSGSAQLLDIGTARPDRLVVLLIAGSATGGANILSCSYGGGAATYLGGTGAVGAGNVFLAVYARVCPTGTTSTFSAPFTAMSGLSVGIFALYGANSTVYDTGNANVDTVRGGAVLGVQGTVAGGTQTHTWSYPAIEEDDRAGLGALSYSNAAFNPVSTASAFDVSCTPTGSPSDTSTFLACFQPAE